MTQPFRGCGERRATKATAIGMCALAEFLLLGLRGLDELRGIDDCQNFVQEARYEFRAEIGCLVHRLIASETLARGPMRMAYLKPHSKRLPTEINAVTSPVQRVCGDSLVSSCRPNLTLLKMLLLLSMGRSTPIFVCEFVSFRQVKPLAQSI